jgi:hypothetical protein
MMYADPGSGVLIWQLLLALFFGAAFYFTRLRQWATAKFRLARGNQAAEESINQTKSRGE